MQAISIIARLSVVDAPKSPGRRWAVHWAVFVACLVLCLIVAQYVFVAPYLFAVLLVWVGVVAAWDAYRVHGVPGAIIALVFCVGVVAFVFTALLGGAPD